jgi:hypothetical protein
VIEFKYVIHIRCFYQIISSLAMLPLSLLLRTLLHRRSCFVQGLSTQLISWHRASTHRQSRWGSWVVILLPLMTPATTAAVEELKADRAEGALNGSCYNPSTSNHCTLSTLKVIPLPNSTYFYCVRHSLYHVFCLSRTLPDLGTATQPWCLQNSPLLTYHSTNINLQTW